VIAADVIIATGSRPRSPAGLNVDHEVVFDSDSILSLAELPRSLAVLGGGVIACEYASIFAGLGVQVTILDRGARPLAFLDADLSAGFLAAFTEMGGTYVGGVAPSDVARNADLSVTVGDGSRALARVDRVLCCLGRVANVEHLQLANAGLTVNERGLLDVDARGRTRVAHIWAAGDVIGAPALASTSMEQGRRAALGALGVEDESARAPLIPTGVYTIPELGAVGLTEAEARAKYGDVRIGRARFDEIARGLISGQSHGMLKLVCDRAGERVLGVHAIGDGACDLVHVGLMAMLGGLPVRTFVEQPMNFPTLAEAYRVAALAVLAPASARKSDPSTTLGAASSAASV
jgi:NAD(P) transhydrogenase